MAAPRGNQYAVGNRGGGAPFGNQNGIKHGGYARITWDMLTDEELALINERDTDINALLIEEIALLNIMERRIMARIRKYAEFESGQVVSRISRSEEKRTFDSEEDREEYERRQREKVEAGDKLPGKPYHLTTATEAVYSLIIQLENHLTICQRQKLVCIEALEQYRTYMENTHHAVNLLEALGIEFEEALNKLAELGINDRRSVARCQKRISSGSRRRQRRG